MAVEPGTIKALIFDVSGTIFDWYATLRGEIDELVAERGIGIDSGRFAIDWRVRAFGLLAQVRSGALPWMNTDHLHRRALDDMLAAHPSFELTAAERDRLNGAWHRLRVWPDVPPALEQLRAHYPAVVLTILGFASVVNSSRAARISWDGILSCEFLGHYKPDLEAYRAGVRLLGIAPHEAMMVSTHAGDLRTVKKVGVRTAYVPRPGPSGEGNTRVPQLDFDFNAAQLHHLATQLIGA